jgi:glutamine synthetase
MSFVIEHDLWSDEQQRVCAELVQRLRQSDIELVRFAWCDVHGIVRGKTLVVSEAIKALRNGVRMVGTLLLKDSSQRTAFQAFQQAAGKRLKRWRARPMW